MSDAAQPRDKFKIIVGCLDGLEKEMVTKIDIDFFVKSKVGRRDLTKSQSVLREKR